MAADQVFAQMGSQSRARTRASAARWEPLEDVLSLLADEDSGDSLANAGWL